MAKAKNALGRDSILNLLFMMVPGPLGAQKLRFNSSVSLSAEPVACRRGLAAVGGGECEKGIAGITGPHGGKQPSATHPGWQG